MQCVPPPPTTTSNPPPLPLSLALPFTPPPLTLPQCHQSVGLRRERMIRTTADRVCVCVCVCRQHHVANTFIQGICLRYFTIEMEAFTEHE